MINFTNIPFSYLCISILISGFTIFALMKSVYIFIRAESSEILPYIFFGLSAALYTTCNAGALIYYIISSDYNSARIIVITRELSTLPFLIIIPYAVSQTLVLEQWLKRINNSLYLIASLSSALISEVSDAVKKFEENNNIFINFIHVG